MRTEFQGVVKDHSLLQDIASGDHHLAAQVVTVLVNSQSIASGSYEHRESLPSSGYKTIRAILRGLTLVQTQGHVGVSAVGSDSSAESMAIGIEPYGGSGYLTSYMGAYSRLHGDSYLTYPGTFGTNIALQDVYLDDDEAVFKFYNFSAYNQNLTVYGTAVIK